MHTQTVSETVVCPNCNSILGPRERLDGKSVRCKSCKYEYTVNGSNRVAADFAHEESLSVDVQANGYLYLLLDRCEDLLTRMIRGVFRFALIRVPKSIYRFVVDFSPTITKLVKVIILLVVYLSVVLGPVGISTFRNELLIWTHWLRSEYPNASLSQYWD